MTEAKRVALIVDHLGAGGYQKQAVMLATGLAGRDYEVLVFTYHSLCTFGELTRSARVKIRCIPKRGRFDLLHLLRFVLSAKHHRYTWVQGMGGSSNFYAAVLALASGAPLGTREGTGSWTKVNWLVKWAFRRSSHVFTNYEEAREGLTKELGLPTFKVHYLPNIVTIPNEERTNLDARREIRKKFDVPEDAFAFLVGARYAEQKNHRAIIRALASMANKARRSLYVCCFGADTDGLMDPLRKEALEAGVHEHIAFHPTIEGLADLAFAFDCGLLMSFYEGTSNFALECLASGLPLICSPVGDMHCLVQDDRTGWLVDPHSTEQIAERMVWAASLPEVSREEIASRAREFARSRYGVDVVLTQYLSAWAQD